jgi:RNA polymerase sigma-70 factor (ECF subfamily)
MARFAQSDHGAFEILLARYRQPLFGFLFRYLGRRDKADDVFQDVFLEVIRARRQYRPHLRFSAWLFRIARNRAVDRLRRNGFREMASLDDPLEAEEADGESRVSRVMGSGPNPEEAAADRELGAALEAAVGSLPAQQREVLWLKETSGLTLAEVARIVGVSENTVKSRLRYALEKIRAHLAQRGYEP